MSETSAPGPVSAVPDRFSSTSAPVVGAGLSTPIDPAVDSGIPSSVEFFASRYLALVADHERLDRELAKTALAFAAVSVERGRAVADLAEARAARDSNAAGVAYWIRRYVETERQAKVDVAAKDRYKAEYAALKAAVEEIRGLALAAQGSVPAAPYTGVGWARLLELTGALAAAVPTPPRTQFGHEGRHHGIGTPECPRQLHHHHDEFCQQPAPSTPEATTPEPETMQWTGARSYQGRHDGATCWEIIAWINANGGEAELRNDQTGPHIAIRAAERRVYAKPGDTIVKGRKTFQVRASDGVNVKDRREFTVSSPEAQS